jgi:hypothetical protein
MFLGSTARPVRRADNLTAESRLTRQCGILNISQPHRPPQPVTGKIVLSFYFYRLHKVTLLLPISVKIYAISCSLVHLAT